MKTTLLFLFVLGLVSFASFAQEKKEIEIQKTQHSTTYSYTDGTSQTKNRGYSYAWRYTGNEKWNSVGKKYENIAPILNQYESSAKLLKQSNNWTLYGSGSSSVLILGGVGMTLFGLFGKKETTVYNPTTGEDMVQYEERKTLRNIGVGTLVAGIVSGYFSGYMSRSKFEKSCRTYNEMVKADEAKIVKSYDWGLALDNRTSYPLLQVKLHL